MSNIDIIRAWKDESYRLSLSDAARALLPESPVGPVELSDANLMGAGGAGPDPMAKITYPSSWCLCSTKSICVC
ncbi:mersacidin/lichenicidin family type 2 lantibiotic [Sorangium sp. So ce726]|uniref:mersacidin/lichenicidin family type 2 lantibiotic n=1 Tax=Sorangium sp. So ce726 TaxID=3133319 RepID=UPI003F632171